MKKLTVIDWNTTTINVYTVDDMEQEQIPEFIIKKGHKLLEIEWMLSENLEIKIH